MTLMIGKFDGVHRGHQALLKTVLLHEKPRIVYTFPNNPAEVLHPERHYTHIYHLEHKLKILKEAGIDQIISESFTPQIAKLTAEEFLTQLHQRTHFTTLILGHDAKLGKGREGTPEVIQSIAKKLNVQVKYLPPFLWKGQVVSSSLVKESIVKADFAAASDWLGRPYSILGPYTTSLDLSGLCLPPSGPYPVHVNGQPATAFLTSSSLTLEPAPSSNSPEIVF